MVRGGRLILFHKLGELLLLTMFLNLSLTLPHMHYFLLPSICRKLDVLNKDFFWGFKESSGRHFYPKAWNTMYKPKLEGGLQFRKSKCMNEALVAKLGWALTIESHKPRV